MTPLASRSKDLFGGTAGSNTTGIALAFGLDALSFLASVVTLWMIRLKHTTESDDTAEQKENVLSSIREGLVHAWNDLPVRLLILNAAAITLLINGPIAVSIPVLSATRFTEADATSHAGAHDEPGNVRRDWLNTCFNAYCRCIDQTESNSVPHQRRRAYGDAFTVWRSKFRDAREGDRRTEIKQTESA